MKRINISTEHIMPFRDDVMLYLHKAYYTKVTKIHRYSISSFDFNDYFRASLLFEDTIDFIGVSCLGTLNRAGLRVFKDRFLKESAFKKALRKYSEANDNL